MSRLVALEPLPDLLMLIIGGQDQDQEPELGAYVFARDELPQPFGLLVIRDRTSPPPPTPPRRRDVGLAFSGGGSRAIAFHLGCLRALHDRGILERVRVISGVSGGAIATAAYAYGHETFADLDARIQALLRRGLQREIARRALLHPRAAGALTARVVSGAAALGASTVARVRRQGRAQPPTKDAASSSSRTRCSTRSGCGPRMRSPRSRC
jgi:hypothetical protein